MSASTTQLSLYNGALQLIGDRQLASLTENRLSRRELDSIWAREGVLRCLEEGMWHHAMRSAQMDYDPDITPQFGFQRAYSDPPDLIRWAGVWEDPYMEVPHTRYTYEAGFTYSDLPILYVKYMSSSIDYGFNYALWPGSFVEYVEAYFAHKIAKRVTGSQAQEDKAAEAKKRALLDAKAKGAMDEPTRFLPPGNWTQSRHGLRGQKDGGSQSSLYG